MKNLFLAKQKFNISDDLIVLFEDPSHYGVFRGRDGNWDKLGYKIVKFEKWDTGAYPRDMIVISLNNVKWSLRSWQVLNLSNIK